MKNINFTELAMWAAMGGIGGYIIFKAIEARKDNSSEGKSDFRGSISQKEVEHYVKPLWTV
jgi:hypothetical protein